jgi:hypothetical protein
MSDQSNKINNCIESDGPSGSPSQAPGHVSHTSPDREVHHLMSTGWIKLHRKFKEWEWYKDPLTAHLFQHLLLSANHDKGRWKGIEVEPGQVIAGLHSLSEGTGISVQSVRTCLNRLKSTNEITIKSTNQFSLITLTNWAIYQGTSTNDSTSELTNDQQTINKRSTTNKKDKKEKKINTIPPSLDEVRNYCTERGNGIDAQYWWNWYEARGWMLGKSKMVSWKSTIHTWEKNNNNGHGKPSEPNMDALTERVLREQHGLSNAE